LSTIDDFSRTVWVYVLKVSRDVTFREDSFLKDNKVEFQKDRKGKAKAVEVEQ